MRKILVTLLTLLFCGWMGASYAQDMQIGYINLKTILDKYEKVAVSEQELMKEAEAKNKEREELVKEVKSLREKLDLADAAQKPKQQAELDGKIKNLQEMTYQAQTTLRQRRDEKFKEIMQEVKDVIDEYGKSKGYNMIMDDALLLYKDAKMDVTEEIVKTLNQRYKKK
ncbi:MAG: OmpH family outer membrane protein [Candidatus Omnitrophota bacterium]